MANIARVLVPTDFTVDSLRIVLDYMEENVGQQVELVLACGYDLGDSITSLLGFTKEDHLIKLENEDFIKGCEMIKSRFTNDIVEMYSDLIISKNLRYLRNYVKGSRITHVVLPDSFEFACSARGVFDVAEVLKCHMDAISATVVPVVLQRSVADGIDTMDSIFFRKDWRVSYE